MNNIFRLAQVFWAYKQGREKLPYKPLRLWIEPTNHCNLRCQMCPHGEKDAELDKGFMEIDLFKRLVQEASGFGADVNLFMGGESLLHPRINEMIAYCKSQGVPSRLYTNATLLNDKKSEEIIKAGLDHITFSFDGTDKTSYEAYRKGAGFDKTLENVRRFLDKKKTVRGRKPYVVIQSMEFQEHSDQRISKAEFKKMFDRKMVNRFTFIEPHSFAGVYKADPVKKQARRYSPCAFLWYSMSISWDGTVVPCCIDLFKKYPVGNAGDHELKELWNSKAMINLRSEIYHGRHKEISLCSPCDVLWKTRLLGVPARSLYNFVEMIASFLSSSRK